MENSKRNFIIIALCLLEAILIAGIVYWVYRTKAQTPLVLDPQAAPQDTVTSSVGTPVVEVPGVDTSVSGTIRYASLPVGIAAAINWNSPEPATRLGLMKVDTYFDYENNATYSQIGTFTWEGKNGRVLLISVPPEGMGYDTAYRLVDFNGQLYLLPRYSDYYETYFGTKPGEEKSLDGYFAAWKPEAFKNVVLDRNFIIPALEFPGQVVGKNSRQILTKEESVPFFGGVKINPADPVFQTDPAHGPLYNSTTTNAFYFVTPDGFPVTYALQPDFFGSPSKNIPAITWSEGGENTAEYNYASVGGCGRSNYLSVIADSKISIARDLRVVGKTSYGDTIYELKDVNHPVLKEFYENSYSIGREGNKIEYPEFITKHPLLYWVDPFGRLVELAKQEFGPLAECGKPVIYLYPEKTTTVSVKVAPKGGFTFTDPPYNGGWNVVAEPSGKLTELSSGKTYPYLFWEGRGGLYQTPKKGFVVQQSEVKSFLVEKLAHLGMNNAETADFLEFWLPRMQEKPYYFITFLGTQEMDMLAPLTLSPQPDTVVRILMDFMPLDQSITVEPLRLGRTPERKGFTVIEWGGVLR